MVNLLDSVLELDDFTSLLTRPPTTWFQRDPLESGRKYNPFLTS